MLISITNETWPFVGMIHYRPISRQHAAVLTVESVPTLLLSSDGHSDLTHVVKDEGASENLAHHLPPRVH